MIIEGFTDYFRVSKYLHTLAHLLSFETQRRTAVHRGFMKKLSFKTFPNYFPIITNEYFFSLCAPLCAAVFLIFSSQTFAQNKISIRILNEKTVERDTIMLGDIAEIRANNLINEQRLKEISLGYAPNPGAIREIGCERILLTIFAAGFAENEFNLDSPKVVAVKRTAQILESKDLREEIEKAIVQSLESDGASAKITRLDVPEKLAMPGGKLSFVVAQNYIRNIFAPFIVSVEIRVDEKVFRRVSANVEIEAFAEILVANKDLPANAKLTNADFHLEKRRLLKPLANYVRTFEDLRGTIALKNIVENSELTKDTIAAGIIVKSGDKLTIIAKSGKLQISISGEALASGKIGDRIAVKNSASGATLQAKILDEGLVIVNW